VRRELAFVLPLVLTLSLAGACAHVDPARERMTSIRFEGNETLRGAQIEERLALTEERIWPWAAPQYFDAGTLRGDQRRLVRFYQAEGFYETRVRSEVRRDGREVTAIFHVEEGPPTVIHPLQIRGMEGLAEDVRRRILAEPLPLVEGERIREEAYDQSLLELERRLREAGHADARVEGRVAVDPARRRARVELLVAPGPRLRFGEVEISGNEQVPRERILEVLRDEIEEGSLYSDSAMDAAQGAIFDLGVFGGVRVSRGPSDPNEETVGLEVSVRESPFQTLRLGGGVAMDKERLEGRAIASYLHRNFLGGLRRLQQENRLGYAYVGEDVLQLQPAEAGVVGLAAVDFTQPELLRRVDGTVHLAYEHGLDPAYRFDSVRGRIGFPIRLSRHLFFTPSYSLQFFALHPFTQGTSSPYRCVDERGDCLLSFVEERVAWDRRDNSVETTSGWYTAISLQQGGGVLGGNAAYQRILAEIRYFQPLPGKAVLALRLEGGLLEPAAGEVSPIMARFYAGGANGMRAFGTRRLAPQKLRSGRTLTADGQVSERGRIGPLRSSDTVAVGGDALIDASAELRFPLAGNLGLTLFLDAAQVAHSIHDLDPSDPNVAVGAGIRYRTPFGPVRLDAGYRVISVLPMLVAGDETLTTTRVPESPFALHFSIGEAF